MDGGEVMNSLLHAWLSLRDSCLYRFHSMFPSASLLFFFTASTYEPLCLSMFWDQSI